MDHITLALRMRQVGLRVSGPRLAVYRTLIELQGHRSVDEIEHSLRVRGKALPRAAVSDVIEALRLSGLVVGVDAGPGRVLYEASDAHHHHFVCRACAQVIDVSCSAGQMPCLPADLDTGRADEAQVIFRGLCNDCAGRFPAL